MDIRQKLDALIDANIRNYLNTKTNSEKVRLDPNGECHLFHWTTIKLVKSTAHKEWLDLSYL